MKRIAPETERKLMTVIEKTAELVNDGNTPNEAIVKAASEAKLRPGEISLVVHAYNTGRTGRQRNDGADPFEKAAEFALADTAEIMEIMYPSQVKTAAATHNDESVSTDYSYSPAPMLARRRVQEKQATTGIDWRSMGGKPIVPAAPLPVDEGHRYKVASAQVDKSRKAAEECRRKQASAFDQLGRTFMDLTTYFRRTDAQPISVVKEAVMLLHGDKGEQLMDQLVHVTPGLTKLSSHTCTTNAAELDCTKAPFPAVARFMSELGDYAEKRAAYEQSVRDYETEAGNALNPFANPAVSSSILGRSSDMRDKAASSFDITDPLKILGTYSLVSRTMGPLAEKLKSPDDSVKVHKAVGQLNDPDHEMKLREINTGAMLQDLMLNDPVISGYDPSEVTGAFNDISQISPSVSDQRMLMQGLLRKRLQQGQLDTFEQDQLLGFEDKLRRQFQPMSGKADGSVLN